MTLETLEVLQKESVLYCEVVRQVQKLDEHHVRQYKSMRKEHHERFVKVIEASSLSRKTHQ
jgi:16S rRNA C1402 (ribose-2'-O) methylase RsmI